MYISRWVCSSPRRKHPVGRVQDPDDGDEAGDEAQEGGDGAGDGDDAEGVGGDEGVADVDKEVAEDALVAAEELGQPHSNVIGGFGLGEE